MPLFSLLDKGMAVSVLTALNMPMKSMYTFPSTSCVRLVRVEICESHIFFLSSDSPITEILDPFSKKKKKKVGQRIETAGCDAAF